MQTKKRFLFLFDFDNTIVDQNTDTYIWKLLPEGENSLPNYIMEDIRNKVWIRTWNKFMRKVLQHYYHINISPDQIKQCLQEMHLSPGFQNLFQYISLNQEIIESSIVSDSNTFFIGSILEKQNLTQLFTKVLTNPVHVIDNVELDIRPFHKNNCQSESCPYNQCKQKAILDNYNIEEYEQVCYFGDGRNDYCACKKRILIGQNVDIRSTLMQSGILGYG
ncbi:hypothetical protein pb186bvf_009904 [Paramecium bursaria]